MQGFAGLSLFSVLLLMALGLAIIFGQMGVINMAHGEFMTIGAYTIYLCSHAVRDSSRRASFAYYFLVAIGAGLRARLRARLAGRVGADPPPLQAPARHAAGHLGPEPDHAADLPLRLRRRRKSARRCPTGCWAPGHRHRGPRHPDQRHVRAGADRCSSPAACCSLMYEVALGPARARHRAEPHDGQRRRHQHRARSTA